MKILVLDNTAESALDWCLRCIDAGHQVRWHFTRTPRNEHIGEGLVERVADWRSAMRWADLIFLPDNTKHLRELEPYRAQGYPIVGPNVAGAAWELDRDEGMRVLERAGIETPTSHEFTSYDDAARFVKKEGRRFVAKPSGVEGDKALTYCSKSAKDMVFMLERWKQLGKLKSSFVLQEFVSGIEFAVGAWFGPGGFIEGWEHNFEFKALMPGDKGPNTGEMGTVQWFVPKSKLANKVLKPLEENLHRIGYVGCIDVNCIIDDKGDPWPLEFTMRPGWPAFQIQQRLQKGDPAEWMIDLIEGRDPRCFKLNEIAVGVVVALPDFPFDHRPAKESVGLPVYGIEEAILDSIHPSMMYRGDAPQETNGKIISAPCLLSAGTYLMTVTGTGATVTAARRGAYSVVDKLEIPGSPIFRNDIGGRIKKQLPKLVEMGYAEGLVY